MDEFNKSQPLQSTGLTIVFQEYYHQLKELEQRILRYEEEIKLQASEGVHAPTIQALQALRVSPLSQRQVLWQRLDLLNVFQVQRSLWLMWD